MHLTTLKAGIAHSCDLAGTAMHYATDALLYSDLTLVEDAINTCE